MLIYIPDLKSTQITMPASQHLFTLHLKSGQICQATDFAGNVAKVEIISLNKSQKQVEFNLLELKKFSRPDNKIIFQAKLDKLYLEKMIEVCTIGQVDQIFVFTSDRTANPKQSLNLNRLKQIAMRAAKQSENPFLPNLKLIENQSELKNLYKEYQPIVLEQAAANYKFKFSTDKKQAVLVGPEGGWSQAELQNFRKLGLSSLSLGKTVLPGWLAGFFFFDKI